MIITADTDRKTIERIAESLLLIPLENSPVKKLSTSMGITIFPEPGDTPQVVIERADKTLFVAKKNGRGNYRFSDEGTVSGQFNFVGRDRELKEFTWLMNQVLKGSGRILEVSGEAGTGKTRLVKEAQIIFENLGGMVFNARGISFATLPPFHLFTSIIRVIKNEKEGMFNQIMENIASPYKDIIKMVISGGFKPEKEPEVFQDALINFFRVLSILKPVMLVLDDIQWADSRSIDTMNVLSSGIARFRIFLCYVVRTPVHNERLSYILSLFHRYKNFTRMQVDELDRKDIENLSPLFNRLSKSELDNIYRHSGGNPLFIEFIIRIPETLFTGFEGLEKFQELSEMVETIVGIIDQDSHLLLRILSLLEEDGTPEFLSMVSGMDIYRVNDILDNLTRLGILSVSGQRGKFQFKHGIVKWAIHNRIKVDEKRRLHKKIADQKLKNPQDSLEFLFSVAYHYILAGERDIAFNYTMKAGVIAESIKGYFEASNLYGLAIDLFDVHEKERKVLGERLVKSLTKSGLGEEAISGIMKVVRDVRIRGEKEKIPGLLYNLAFSYYRARRYDEMNRFADMVLQELDEDSPYYWNINLLVGSAITNEKEAERAIFVAEKGIKYFNDRQDSYEYGYFWHLLAIGYLAKQELKKAMESSKKTIEIFKRFSSGTPSWVYNDHGEIFMASGNFKEAERYFNMSMEDKEDAGNYWLKGSFLMNIAIVERERGEYEKSTGLLEKAIEYLGMCQLLKEVDIARISIEANRVLSGDKPLFKTDGIQEEMLVDYLNLFTGISLIEKGEFHKATELLITVWESESHLGFPLLITTGAVIPPVRILFFIVLSFILENRIDKAQEWWKMFIEGVEKAGTGVYVQYARFFEKVLGGERPSLRPLNPLSFSLEKRIIWKYFKKG